jgi:predicted DNA binding CopG/RHH family protein
MTKRLKKLPKFKNEAEERKYWHTHDSTLYVDWLKAERVHFPNLKPSSHPVSIRVPQYLIVRLKEQANELNIPYQTLMKQYIAKGVLEKPTKK